MIIPTVYTPVIVQRSSLKIGHKSPRTERVPDTSPPIDSVEAVAEEIIIGLRANREPDLQGVVSDYKKRPSGGGLIFEVTLSWGQRMFILLGNSKRKLRELKGQIKARQRKLAQGIVARVGESTAALRTRIANSIRTICHAIANRVNSEDENRLHNKREREARWIVRKNFHPHFVGSFN